MTDIPLEKRNRRTLLLAFLVALPIGVAIPVAAVVLAFERSPLVRHPEPLVFEDAARVRALLQENNPRRMAAGEVRTASVTERECNLLLSYALSRFGRDRIFAAVDFGPDAGELRITVKVPGMPLFVNGVAGFTPSEAVVDLTHLRIGAVRLPSFVFNWARDIAYAYLEGDPELRIVLTAIRSFKKLELDHNRAALTYEWRREAMMTLKQQGQGLVFSSQDREIILRYHRFIEEIERHIEGDSAPLSLFLPHLFRLAKARTERGADPVQENRLLILTLGTYTLGKRIERLIGVPSGEDAFPKKKTTLNGRRDLAMHFMVSAALAASAGTALANFAGVFKEVSDSQGGSGFSFADLLADRAGVRMGELAIGSEARAVRLQAAMAEVRTDADFMPGIDALPEGLQEAAFKQRYKDLDSRVYRAAEDEMSRRIDACPAYR